MQLKHTQNYLCSVWRRCGDWADFLKWFVKFRAGCFLLDDTAQPCAPVGADDHPVETSRAVMCATGGPLQSACAAGRPLQSRVPQGGRCSHVCRRGAAAVTCAAGGPLPHSECPDQALRSICASSVMSITVMFEFLISSFLGSGFEHILAFCPGTSCSLSYFPYVQEGDDNGSYLMGLLY